MRRLHQAHRPLSVQAHHCRSCVVHLLPRRRVRRVLRLVPRRQASASAKPHTEQRASASLARRARRMPRLPQRVAAAACARKLAPLAHRRSHLRRVKASCRTKRAHGQATRWLRLAMCAPRATPMLSRPLRHQRRHRVALVPRALGWLRALARQPRRIQTRGYSTTIHRSGTLDSRTALHTQATGLLARTGRRQAPLLPMQERKALRRTEASGAPSDMGRGASRRLICSQVAGAAARGRRVRRRRRWASRMATRSRRCLLRVSTCRARSADGSRLALAGCTTRIRAAATRKAAQVCLADW